MNLDSLITVAGLFVAVYAIIPRVRRLELSLRFGKFGWAILCVSFLTILYMQFYKTFIILGLTPGLNLSRWSINTSNASFITLLLMTLTLLIYISIKGVSKSNIVKFREYVFELSREKKYSELFSLIEGNLIKIARVYNGHYLFSRFRDYLYDHSKDQADFLSLIKGQNATNQETKPKLRKKACNLWIKTLKIFANSLPTYDKEKDVAKEIIHEVLINRYTVKAMAEIRPYFALKILSTDFYENNQFVDTYLRCLAEDTKSILYHEIRNNQNLTRNYEYALPSKNRLLSYLFKDCNLAEKYGVYKPIGEFVIAHLDHLYSHSQPDPYNEPMGEFYEEGQWDSKLLVGIKFFDIMVTSALYQNIQWHMWLYYFPYFVERIERNLAPNEKLVDLNDEWPTKYHYALYEITSCLCKWITAVDHISLNQENIALETTSAAHENGNIPKSSMLALGQIVKLILTSNRVSCRFKKYITDMIYRRYFELMKKTETASYAKALINSVLCGGFSMNNISHEYVQCLLNTFERFDRIPYNTHHVDELRNILKREYNSI